MSNFDNNLSECIVHELEDFGFPIEQFRSHMSKKIKKSVVCAGKYGKKKGKIKKANQISHRYNHLPLLPSGPGGVRQELVVSICPHKINHKSFEFQSNEYIQCQYSIRFR